MPASFVDCVKNVYGIVAAALVSCSSAPIAPTQMQTRIAPSPPNQSGTSPQKAICITHK